MAAPTRTRYGILFGIFPCLVSVKHVSLFPPAFFGLGTVIQVALAAARQKMYLSIHFFP